MESSQNSRSGLRHYRRTKSKAPPPPPAGSDSEGSGDSNSVSGESQNGYRSQNDRHKSVTKKGDWEILSGLKEGQRFEFTPSKFEGYLLKRRKWPLKGWHKRYFVLEDSVLTYAKNAAELTRGKKHGSMDIGMSVVSTKASRRRIDIDADASIIHLKCKSREVYMQWVEQLKQHRLRKQHQLLYATQTTLPGLLSPMSPSDDSPTDPVSGGGSLTGTLPASLPGSLPGTLVRDAFSPSAGGTGTLRPRKLESSILDELTADFATAGQTLHQLTKLLQWITEHQDTALQVSQLDPSTPSSTKTRRKFRLRKNKSSKNSNSQDIAGLSTAGSSSGLCSSPSPLVHQCSLNTAGDRTSTRSEDINHHLSSTSVIADSNLADLRKLSSSNPALSHSTPHSDTSPHPSTPHFFPPSASKPPLSTSDSTSLLPNSSPPILPSISVDSSSPIQAINSSTSSTAQDFAFMAKDLLSQLNSLFCSLSSERERWQKQFSSGEIHADHSSTTIIAALREHLNTALQQNAELRNRLHRIHADADISNLAPLSCGLPNAGDNPFSSPSPSDIVHKTLVPSMSYESSSCFSASEYFDAPEGEGNRTHSDDDDDGSSSDDRSTPASATTSDASDAGTEALTSVTDLEDGLLSKCFTGRRTKLLVPRNNKEDFSVFNFLYKNIGKDLSKVSMPVTINEPLNMLQRLCEELEYSELLDKAASLRDPAERMVQVAAFAVSAYASSIHRAAHKPFNPLLGETYECIREDKGFKFVAEQVSHHPPISACHAQGPSFTMWQDIRIKTKFWGKSLEFQPSGKVHLTLSQHNDVYEWNKVTSCVHNLFGGGSRWVDQYGEAVITNSTYNLTCKLTFVKASSWSSKRHEVFGTITDGDGAVLHNLFGRWTEALYCGHAPSAKVVWRPGSMPENSHLYYGFTRFAIELNELLPDMERLLPPTDTRFRPDQRLLEEGRIEESESHKQRLELLQRNRRKKRESDGTSHVPMWFRLDEGLEEVGSEEEAWVFNGEYWNKRKDPGFANMSFEGLW